MNRWIKICIVTLSLNAASAFAATAVTLYKSPACECCEKYVQYLEQNGFAVMAINEDDMDAVRKRYGTARAASCHTALIDGYAVEGHVPVRAIRKLLREEQPGTLTIYAISNGDSKLMVF